MVSNEIAFCGYEKQNIKWMQFCAYDLKQPTGHSDNEQIFVIIFIFSTMRMKEDTSLWDCRDNG